MGLILNPTLVAELQPIYTVEGGICTAGPQAWSTTGPQIDLESTSHHDGVHQPEKGELHGSSVPLLQDTFITGSAGFTGKDFTVVSGSMVNLVNTRTQKAGLHVPKSNDTFDAIQTTPSGKIQSKHSIIHRGANSIANTSPSLSNYNCYLELCHGNNTNIQIALEWGKALRMDYYDGTWHTGVSTSDKIHDLEAYFANNNDQITLKILADYTDDIITVKCGNYVNLKFKWPGGIPAYENVRWYGQNGWATYEEYPLRFKPLTVQKSARDFGELRGGSFVTMNGRGSTHPDQVNVKALTGDGQSVGYVVQSSLPDAGEGIGSLDPVKGVDYTLITPSVWVVPLDSGTVYFPPAMYADMLETLDDATQTTHASCHIPVNNWNNRYTNSYGHASLQLGVSTPYDNYSPVFRGVGGWGPEGIKIFQLDPTRLMEMPGQDNSVKMMIPLNEEVSFDSWYARNVVEFCMEAGNIRKEFLRTTMPAYVPPDGTPDAPYGPAGRDAPPEFILPSGSGLQGKWTFLPDATPWSILQRLVMDLGETDPISGENIPYYMGFDVFGNFNFTPYNPRSIFNSPRISFGDYDPTGYGLIQKIEVYNSIYQMRSSIDFQGVDAFTNELLYFHLNLPDIVLKTIGFRYPWLERDSRFASLDYMARIANNAAVQASRPTQVWRVKVPYHPYLRVGMNALTTSEALNGTAEGYITEIRSKVGVDDTGHNHCYSYVTMRSIYNF